MTVSRIFFTFTVLLTYPLECFVARYVQVPCIMYVKTRQEGKDRIGCVNSLRGQSSEAASTRDHATYPLSFISCLYALMMIH